MLLDTITPDGYIVDSSGAWISDAKKYWNIDFTENDIERIEFYNIPVPAAAKKKVITSKEDFSKIYNSIVNNIVVSAEEQNSIVGGINKIVIIKKDQTEIVLSTSLVEITYNGKSYPLKKIFPADELWANLNYAEISVPQNELP